MDYTEYAMHYGPEAADRAVREQQADPAWQEQMIEQVSDYIDGHFAYMAAGPFSPPTDPRTWPTWNEVGKTITIPASDYDWRD